MSQSISTDCFKRELLDVYRETFEQVQGMYLDKGTSLFETLDTFTADEASHPISQNGASIAAHVEHTRFYMCVLERCLQKNDPGKIDWDETWNSNSLDFYLKCS